MSPYEPVPQHVDAAVQPVLAGPQMGATSRHEHQYPRRGLLEVLWRRRLIVVLVLLLSAAGGYIYLREATPIYKASARILVESPVPFPGDPIPGARTVNLNNECQVMASGRVLADALNGPGICELGTFRRALDALDLPDLSISIAPGEDRKRPPAVIRVTIPVLVDGLSIDPGKQNDLIIVSFESRFREDVHRIANAVANAYKAHKDKQKQKTAAEILTILEAEKMSREKKVKSNLQDLLAFKKNAAALLAFEGQINQRLERLSKALTESELELVRAKALHDAVTALKDDAAVRQFFETRRAVGGTIIIMEDEGARLQSELAQLEMRLRAAKRQYAPSHPAIKALEDEIADRKKRIAEREETLAARQVAAVKAQYASAESRHKDMKAAYEKQHKQALALNKALADCAEKQYALEQSRQDVELLVDRMKELSVTKDVGATNVTILQRAAIPENPDRPKKIHVAATAIGLGLLLGVALAMLRDRMDARLRSAAEISAALGAPVVGALPRIKGRKGLVSRGQRILQAPQSADAEAYRGVRTALAFGVPSESRARTILVTSPAASEGKSTLVSNLAISMAQAGQRTLIVDADFRQPHQHKIFHLDNGRGLSDALTNGTAWVEAIQRTDTDGLDVLPAGPTLQRPADALNSRAFAKLMQDLAGRYDHILIDSPPVMCASDSLILAALCDTTLLVVRAEQSDRRIAEQAREGLASVGARVFGAVVNAVPRKKARYAYYAGMYASGNGRRENGNGLTAIVSRPARVPQD